MRGSGEIIYICRDERDIGNYWDSEEICSNWPKLAVFAWHLIFAWWRVNLCYYLTGTRGQVVSAAGFDGNYWHPHNPSSARPCPRAIAVSLEKCSHGHLHPYPWNSFTLISFSMKWFPHILNILTAFQFEVADLEWLFKVISLPQSKFALRA